MGLLQNIKTKLTKPEISDESLEAYIPEEETDGTN